MNTSVKTLSDTKVQLTIALEPKEIADAEQVALTKLAHNVKAPGFRKGKVPAGVAKKHIEPEKLAMEAADNAISKAVAEAFVSEKIQALERPQVEVTKFVPGEVLEFTAEAEVVPEIKLADYKKLKLKKPAKPSVTKDQISEVVERVRTQMATQQPVKRAAKDGDEVTFDFVGKLDGKEFDGGAAKGHKLVLGSGQFIPGFEAQMVGHAADEEFSLEVSFPDNYQAKDLAGKKAVFDIVLHSVSEVTLPKLTDEFAAKVGEFTSVKELESDIKAELTARAEQDQLEELREQAVMLLVDKSKVPVPEVLIADQLQSLEQDFTQNLSYQGMTLESYLESKGFKDKDEWIEKEAKATAEKRVKSGLALSELSKKEKIEVSDEDLIAKKQALQQQYASQPEVLKQLETEEVDRDLRNRLATEKTIDRLLDIML